MYKYWVSAKNAMGYGVTSSVFQFSSWSVPEKPPSPPWNNKLVTSSSTIEIEYDEIIKNGGANILKYYVYIDDGNFGSFGPKMDNGLSLTFNTASYGLTLLAG